MAGNLMDPPPIAPSAQPLPVSFVTIYPCMPSYCDRVASARCDSERGWVHRGFFCQSI